MDDNKLSCTLCSCDKVIQIDSKIRNVFDDYSKMYECIQCGTHFLYPQPQMEQLEEYYNGQFREEVHTASYYDEVALTKVFNKFTPEAKERADRVKNDLSLSDEILEIGCSVGYFLAAVSDKVEKVYGTEWDSRARSYIKEIINNKKIETAKDPQDFDKQFDKIFMFHVLEHISDPVQYLKNLKPLLKDNGRIYIEVPNVDDIMVKTFKNVPFKDFYYKKAHLYNFNEKGLQYIFEKSGFEYELRFIQRYDISNHFYWLANGIPGGKGFYRGIISDKVNEEYVKSLIDAKQTDTLFAIIKDKNENS